ncbi:MAG: FKBP-type peptidyl-prolyl cis-trans isomerase [Pseudomonadota bacterium]|nr:FKBP-type peptidyl-prolyl cis-trans isomerase [Pseudomonadota bacterium]
MKISNRGTTVLAVAALSMALAGCNAAEKPESDSTAAQTEAGAADAIAGLPTEKDRVSYMIGLDVAKSLEQIEDEIDVAIIAKAMKDGLAGEKVLMTEEQATQVRESFGQKMQAKQIADAAAKAQANLAAGKTALAENAKRPDVTTTASGLQYEVIEAGSGPKPSATDTVRVHYKGTLLDGNTFDSSYERGEPVVFSLEQVVPGWQEGIALMPVGSKYRFWIPSDLAYGEQGTQGGPIGPNEALVFEVELQDIVKDAAK